MLVPLISTSQMAAVAVAETDFAAPMVAADGSTLYEFVSSTACWIKQGTAPVAASAATGSKFCAAGERVYIDPRDGLNLSVIRDAVDGKATLTKLRPVG